MRKKSRKNYGRCSAIAEISYNSIFDGVTLALHQAFPSALIHGGKIDQGVSAGDFNVLPIAPNHTEQVGTRAQRDMSFDVVYYPTEKGGRAECLKIADELSHVLGTIVTPNGDGVHGTGFEYMLNDDAMHCIVHYPHFVYTPRERDMLETLTIKQEV